MNLKIPAFPALFLEILGWVLETSGQVPETSGHVTENFGTGRFQGLPVRFLGSYARLIVTGNFR